MAEPTFINELSPLDQIRLVEAEVARKVVVARDVAEHCAANAHAQAALIKKEAEMQGIREGQICYKETVAKAEEQAQVILAQADRESNDLCQMGRLRMNLAVNEALRIILGVKGGSGS